MNVRPLQGELETLDHRRARLREYLEPGMVSAELRNNLLESLMDVERRIQEILMTSQQQRQMQRQAA
ncbi:MAG: hypothetical protein JWO87_313 [Phycisphaerales bacterium]|jgi:hypothetical protein|nr:hypothetical protein [Phycisphaerales bacterium]MDB5298650.1 hypothetical protein [Phycisphaerales bacterium]MDB5304899.1 hypothetical protein [Phycisphaerales bacterium]